ncbi:MAG: hypothetical protein AAF483_10785 [Planctomycetota bacterium]
MTLGYRTQSSASMLLAGLAIALLAGCGGGSGYPRAAVSGTITLEGIPMPEGSIRFVPIDGTSGGKLSVTVADGAFSIDAANGPAVGTHRIEIESTDSGGLAMDDEDAIDKLKADRVKRVDVVIVPDRYNKNSKMQETLTAEGPNELKFELSLMGR